MNTKIKSTSRITFTVLSLIIAAGLVHVEDANARTKRRRGKNKRHTLAASIGCLGLPSGFQPLRTAADFEKLRSSSSGKFFMCQNIDFRSIKNFSPITSFNGILDGNSKILSNLKINTSPSSIPAGLISSLGPDGIVRRLSIRGATVYGLNHVGTIAGVAGGKVLSSSVDSAEVYSFGNNSSIGNTSSAGGLVGFLQNEQSEISGCQVTRSSISGALNSGGIVGRAIGQAKVSVLAGTTKIDPTKISLCSVADTNVAGPNTYDVASSSSAAGGAVGELKFGEIKTTFFEGNIANAGDTGGIAGRITASNISDSECDAVIGGLPILQSDGSFQDFQPRAVGGIVGFAGFDASSVVPGTKARLILSSSVIRSSSRGAIIGGVSLGGIVGELIGSSTAAYSTTVIDSYSHSTLFGKIYVGGLIGTARYATLTRSYFGGEIKATSGSLNGGLVGNATRADLAIQSSFFDKTTNAYASDFSGSGRDTNEMKSISLFSRAAWSIALDNSQENSTWRISPNGDAFPELSF